MVPDRNVIGFFLWQQSLTERVAAGVFYRLASSPVLSSDDRQTAAVFAQQETSHADQLRAAARRYVPTRPVDAVVPFQAVMGGTPLTVAVALLHAGERVSAPSFRSIASVFDALDDPITATLYRQFVIDEAPHLAFGHRLLTAWRVPASIRRDARHQLVTLHRHARLRWPVFSRR